MIRHETISVSGTVLYCDLCKVRGPQAAYDNAEEVTEAAMDSGWTTDDQDRVVCPKCTANGGPE